MAIYDWQGNFVKDSDDGQDYWLSEDGLVKLNEEGYQVDSHGNPAFGGGSAPAPPKPVRQWKPVQVERYRPPNFDIRLWRG